MSSIYDVTMVSLRDHRFESSETPDLDNLSSVEVVFGRNNWTNETGDNSLELLSSLTVPSEPNYWCLLLLVFPVLTVFGNVLVCLSVYNEKALHTVTNYFIFSLAIADIMVAILVMPLAVYVEVAGAIWRLGDALCDTWVAFDVMCCTSSILNLTAISVDRYIAVTRPIQYAKHRNSPRRVHVTLGLTWVVSIAVSSPIALGANYTDRRAQTPWLCTFYNSDFLIGSSMTSFYVPCILMILLYWRTFRAINARACKMAAMTSGSGSRGRKSAVRVALTGSGSVAARAVVVESKDARNTLQLSTMTSATTSCSERDGDGDGDGERENSGRTKHRVSALMHYGADESVGIVTSGCKEYKTFHVASASASASPSDESPRPTSQPSTLTTISRVHPTDDGDRTEQVPTAAFVPVSSSRPQTLVGRNGKSIRHPIQQQQQQRRRRRLRITTLPIQPTSTVTAVNVGERSRHPNGDCCQGDGFGTDSGCDNGTLESRTTVESRCHGSDDKGGQRQRVRRRSAVFGFNLQRFNVTSLRNESKLSTKRERKATKTLAIVLGVFLLCWVPFFSLNIINAVCLRDDLFATVSVCNIHPMAFSMFVWLGYINSFLNPLIYTIFNIEFRKAFKKILLRQH